jgi:hypothetical protein
MKFVSKGAQEETHRLIILTDMENEPDDSQTMVKLLMYSNEIDIEGLIAVTSTWLKDVVFPESIEDRIHAYGTVMDNLRKHAAGWPTVEYLLSRTAGGQVGCGMEAVGDGKESKGSEIIIQAVDKDDPRPVWVAINAGSNTLAQALWTVRQKRSEEELKRFISKIRVYDDSGQDDAGAWMCHTFPDLFYIRSRAQVFGLFGPTLDSGPKPWLPLDQWDWAEMHIRTRHGALGALYPQRIFKNGKFAFMDGGGTTTWLGLVNKGLFVPEQITWGGWGGRFSNKKEQVPAGQFAVDATEGKYAPWAMYPEAKDDSFEWEEKEVWDSFSGVQGEKKYDWKTFAPLWRWRVGYTNDFKARMDWCVTDFMHANHHPVIDFYGDTKRTVVYLEAEPGEKVFLDASGTYDPDDRIKSHDGHGKYVGVGRDDKLTFKWYCYPEAGTYGSSVDVKENAKSIAHVTIPKDAKGKQIHVILEVTDDDQDAPLTSYRRIVMNII